MTGKLRKREVGALRDKAHAFGNFVGPNRAEELSVNGEPAGS